MPNDYIDLLPKEMKENFVAHLDLTHSIFTYIENFIDNKIIDRFRGHENLLNKINNSLSIIRQLYINNRIILIDQCNEYKNFKNKTIKTYDRFFYASYRNIKREYVKKYDKNSTLRFSEALQVAKELGVCKVSLRPAFNEGVIIWMPDSQLEENTLKNSNQVKIVEGLINRLSNKNRLVTFSKQLSVTTYYETQENQDQINEFSNSCFDEYMKEVEKIRQASQRPGR